MMQDKENIAFYRYLHTLGLCSKSFIYNSTKGKGSAKIIDILLKPLTMNNDVVGFQEFCKNFQEFKKKKKVRKLKD